MGSGGEQLHQFKPEAKCRYYHLCTLYNNGVLSVDVEIAMCGRLNPIDQNYVPFAPEPAEFIPSKRYHFKTPGGTCDAFLRYTLSELISEIMKTAKSIQTSQT